MPLNETSGNVTTDAFGGGVAAVPTYIEQVFSTWLYTGNGTFSGETNVITNNIDLATQGGMVWIKNRTTAGTENCVSDTVRGGTSKMISTNSTAAQTGSGSNISFQTTGFTALTSGTNTNYTGENYVSWTFRKQPKFFTVGTYSGNGTTQAITHDLGSAPGCVIVKNVTTAGSWIVYHSGLTSGYYIQLNGTSAQDNTNAARRFGNNSTTVNPTSTTITVGDLINTSGDTWVYYAFASNAGGFGLTGTDNVISCGSFTVDGSYNISPVTLGYEPQYVMMKRTDVAQDWYVVDTMRGFTVANIDNVLFPNTAGVENAVLELKPNATGFYGRASASATYIYIAIRRGPMKVPTTGTSVYKGISRSGTGATATISGVGFAPDLAIGKDSGVGGASVVSDKLRGAQNELLAQSTDAETFYSNDYLSFTNDGALIGSGSGGWLNGIGRTNINWFFGRAPNFFDEVCYTGTGSATTFNHNLGVVPELMIVKERDVAGAWRVYVSSLGNTNHLVLNNNGQVNTGDMWNSTNPTSTVFSIGTSYSVNRPAGTFVNYLFATCAGVSKVGSYTGNGSTQTINCGFTGGARFVLIKRTDAAGDWYVYDTARGMTTLTDPYLLMNTTDAETATLGSVTTVTTGFAVNASILAAINTNGGSYIYLAIS